MATHGARRRRRTCRPCYARAALTTRGPAAGRCPTPGSARPACAVDRGAPRRLRPGLPAAADRRAAGDLSAHAGVPAADGADDRPFVPAGAARAWCTCATGSTCCAPIGAGRARSTCEVWAERFAAHRSGAAVDLCAAVSAAGEEVWRSTSTYLARGAKAPEGAPEADIDVAGRRPPAEHRHLADTRTTPDAATPRSAAT